MRMDEWITKEHLKKVAPVVRKAIWILNDMQLRSKSPVEAGQAREVLVAMAKAGIVEYVPPGKGGDFIVCGTPHCRGPY